MSLRVLRSSLLTVCVALILASTASAREWYTRKSDWNGFEQYYFEVAERSAWVVVPTQAAAGNPWIWRARFPGFHAEMDLELVRQGFHLAYIDVAGMFGSPKAVAIGDEFHQYLTTQRGLAAKAVMEGVSRGGLFVYNWTVQNPKNVACIYCDTPVLDFKSWPGGKGSGRGSAGDWKQCLNVYGFTEQQAIGYSGNPVDVAAAVIVSHKIPVLHIVSENDVIVPPAENTRVLQQQLQMQGYAMPVISVKVGTKQSSGHHFTHPDPDRVVKFIMKNGMGSKP